MSLPKTCSHGVPFGKDDRCIGCELVSEESGLEWALQKVERHRRAIARLTAEAALAASERRVEQLQAAISWLEPPFCTADTPDNEVRKRISFMLGDAARALLNPTEDKDSCSSRDPSATPERLTGPCPSTPDLGVSGE